VRRITRQLHQFRMDSSRFWFAALLSLAGLMASAGSATAQNQGAPAKREAPKELQIEDELITDEEATDWRKKERNNFNKALNDGKLNSTTQPKIAEGIRMLVHELSLKSRRDTIAEVRKKVVRDTDPVAKGQQMREFVMSEIVKRAKELLDGNLHVRMQAVLLISELNIDPGQFPRKPPIAYVQGATALIDIVDPPPGGIDQPQALRVMAASGIARLLREGRQALPPNQKLTPELAPRLLSQLKQRNHQWYTRVLMDALVETGLTVVAEGDNAPRPLIIEALARLMADSQQPYEVRTHAMYCLGRAPMPGGINASPIAWAASQLTAQIATDINQGKVNGNRGFFLLQSIYYGYKPEDGTEMTTDGRGRAGLMNSLAGQPVQAAYRDFLVLFNGVLKLIANDSRIIAAPQAIQTLREAQKPANLTIAGGGPSVDQPLVPHRAAKQGQNAQNPAGN